MIPAYWQSLWNALSQVATMLGSTAAGPIQDRFGRRAAFLVAACLSAAGIAVVYTASTPGAFLAGKIVNGLSLGLALTTGQTYISEITSLEVRGIALSGYTFCMVCFRRVYQQETVMLTMDIVESGISDRRICGSSSHGNVQ